MTKRHGCKQPRSTFVSLNVVGQLGFSVVDDTHSDVCPRGTKVKLMEEQD